MKKIFAIFSLVLVSLITACTAIEKPDEITLSLSSGPIQLEVGKTHQLSITTNDTLGYDISSSNHEVVTVSSTGLVTALKEGTSVVTVTSKTNEEVSKSVNIHVTKTYNLVIDEPSTYLWAGQTLQLSFETSGEEVTFKSNNEAVATVDNNGLVTAVSPGNFKITMTLASDISVKAEISLVVYDETSTILLEGDSKLNVGQTTKLSAILGPETAAPALAWSSSDEFVATVDDEGTITAHKSGTVTITATSLTSTEVSATHSVIIVNELVVDGEAKTGDKVVVEDLEFEFGTTLFNTLEAALDTATDGAHIYLKNIELLTLTILDKSVTLEGINDQVVAKNLVSIDASDVVIKNIAFNEQGAIHVLQGSSNVSIMNNRFTDLNEAVLQAILVEEAQDLSIEQNEFKTLKHDAIVIDDIISGSLNINKNIIDGAKVAIKLAGSSYSNDTEILIQRNSISNIEGAFDVSLNDTEILAYARFNAVSSFSEYPAKANLGSNFDFTLNYWGSATIDLNQFENISERMLMGHYESEAVILKEADYDPTAPLFIYITSDLKVLDVSDEIMLKFEYLPYELKDGRFRFRTDAPDTLLVTGTGLLKALSSGQATIRVEASHKFSNAQDSITLDVTTDPGIDLVPSIDTHSLVAGDSVRIEATPFPVTIKDSEVLFESSNSAIATVDSEGLVTSLTSGSVIITARLVSDVEVKQEIYLDFYENLDQNNLMDLITMNQQSHLKMFDFYEIGTGPTYRVVGYESVSNYYFDEVTPDTSLMIPDIYKGKNVRPGLPLSPIPAGYTTYNDKNIHWITVHDTANTATGSGALSHANYLNNQARINGAQVSWHYTIDDKAFYQHIPEGEVAWHAGDGSNIVGQGSYLGGGNRNAIAIEMSVAMGDDLYRIWQRTAKFSAETLVKYNLPREHIKFHQHFSGKHCPNALLVSGLEPKFQKMADIEYKVALEYPGAQISMVSNHPDIIDNMGRVISMPLHNTLASYTVTVVYEGVTTSRTFNVYVPGTTR